MYNFNRQSAIAPPTQKYLEATTIIDWENPAILKLANKITSQYQTQEMIAKACFEWVRDEIKHSVDYQINPVTCRASNVLKYKTGYCYAKSHLLAALLRAHGIPTGFCYQRLSINDQGAPYSLHGFNAIYLQRVGWYRVDPRGNNERVDAQFIPPTEQLAYSPSLSGEADFQNILPQPLSVVTDRLQNNQSWEEVRDNLPDLPPQLWAEYGLNG
jgi:transglutaminase-like putative cysteine protease